MISRHHNHEYDGGSPNIPLNVGDRYYSQDLGRDFHYLLDRAGLTLSDVFTAPNLLKGGAVTKGTGDTLNITTGYGYAKLTVTIPDDALIPPTDATEDIEAIRIAWDAQTNMAISGATLNGVATNYVKVAYVNSTSLSRDRAKKSGSYAFSQSPSYVISVDTTPNTAYEVLLATFVGTAGGAFTISTVTPAINISAGRNFSVDTNTLFVDSANHKVGVGITASLLAKLHVEDTSGLTAFFGNSATTNNSYITGAGINVGYNSDSDGVGLAINYAGYLNGVTRYRDTAIYDGKHNLLLKVSGSTGYVGIGAAPTLAYLQVETPISTVSAIFGVSATANNVYFLNSSIGAGYGSNAKSTLSINYGGYQGGYTQFRNINIGDGKSHNYVYFDGENQRVGIKVASPSYELDVDGTINLASGGVFQHNGNQILDSSGNINLATGLTITASKTGASHCIFGAADTATYAGVVGTNNIAGGYGVYGASSSGYGVYGTGFVAIRGDGTYFGVYGIASNAGSGKGVYGSGVYGVYGSGTTYGVYSDGDMYTTGDCSALTFTDRTPYYSGDALKEIMKITGDDKNGIDHKTLPSFAYKKVKGKHLKRDNENKLIENEFIETTEDRRDLGAMISILTVAIQQIVVRLEKLEK